MRKEAQQLPSGNPNDPNFRRLHYCRYADDWLLGFIGPKREAEAIKRQIGHFLSEHLKLELSEEKTLITHARTEKARFLSYHITTMHNDTYQTKRVRRINGQIKMSIPHDVLMEKCQNYMRGGKPIHKMILIDDTAYSIMTQYQAEYRGFVEYYQLANDIGRCSLLKWVMGISLTKTLAKKLKRSVSQIRKKYAATVIVNGKPYKALQVRVPREGKKPLVATWGGIPLQRKPHALLKDEPPIYWAGRSELEKRLLADTCELCGSREKIEVHHIRALKDLNQKGRREKPHWMAIMASRKRKTLVVCQTCHKNIHAGRPA